MDKIPQRILIQQLFAAGDDLQSFSWQPFHEGVEIHRLYGGDNEGASAALLRYAPGAGVPYHQHQGYEHILVLQGSQQDELGVYQPGTLLINGPGTHHKVYSEQGCIVLAILEKPVDLQH